MIDLIWFDFIGGEDEEMGMEEEEECIICYTNPPEMILLPCRHFSVCSDCFKHIDKCPVCRAPFDQYTRIVSNHSTTFQTKPHSE